MVDEISLSSRREYVTNAHWYTYSVMYASRRLGTQWKHPEKRAPREGRFDRFEGTMCFHCCALADMISPLNGDWRQMTFCFFCRLFRYSLASRTFPYDAASHYVPSRRHVHLRGVHVVGYSSRQVISKILKWLLKIDSWDVESAWLTRISNCIYASDSASAGIQSRMLDRDVETEGAGMRAVWHVMYTQVREIICHMWRFHP